MALEPIPIEGPGRPLPFELITVPACRFTITVKGPVQPGLRPAKIEVSDRRRIRPIRRETTAATSVERSLQDRILWSGFKEPRHVRPLKGR